jgi:hypothetical protein
MAPEVFAQEGYNYLVDFYTLGALLYEFMTGLPPFYAASPQEILKNIKTQTLNFPKGISNELKELLQALLEKRPEKRIQRIDEIKAFRWLRNVDWLRVKAKADVAPLKLNPFENYIHPEFLSQEVKQQSQRINVQYKSDFEHMYYVKKSSEGYLHLNDESLKGELNDSSERTPRQPMSIKKYNSVDRFNDGPGQLGQSSSPKLKPRSSRLVQLSLGRESAASSGSRRKKSANSSSLSTCHNLSQSVTKQPRTGLSICDLSSSTTVIKTELSDVSMFNSPKEGEKRSFKRKSKETGNYVLSFDFQRGIQRTTLLLTESSDTQNNSMTGSRNSSSTHISDSVQNSPSQNRSIKSGKKLAASKSPSKSIINLGMKQRSSENKSSLHKGANAANSISNENPYYDNQIASNNNNNNNQSNTSNFIQNSTNIKHFETAAKRQAGSMSSSARKSSNKSRRNNEGSMSNSVKREANLERAQASSPVNLFKPKGTIAVVGTWSLKKQSSSSNFSEKKSVDNSANNQNVSDSMPKSSTTLNTQKSVSKLLAYQKGKTFKSDLLVQLKNVCLHQNQRNDYPSESKKNIRRHSQNKENESLYASDRKDSSSSSRRNLQDTDNLSRKLSTSTGGPNSSSKESCQISCSSTLNTNITELRQPITVSGVSFKKIGKSNQVKTLKGTVYLNK